MASNNESVSHVSVPVLTPRKQTLPLEMSSNRNRQPHKLEDSASLLGLFVVTLSVTLRVRGVLVLTVESHVVRQANILQGNCRD